MKVTEDQADTLRHMLGLTDPYAPRATPTRDYYCANPGDPHLAELARIGAVERYAVRDGYEWFKTTEAGRFAAVGDFVRRIQKPRKARVWRMYVRVRDYCSELTFGEFITSPDWADYRNKA